MCNRFLLAATSDGVVGVCDLINVKVKSREAVTSILQMACTFSFDGKKAVVGTPTICAYLV